MKYKLMTITTAATLSILLTLSVSLPAYSFTGVTGNWVMTQAASQSQGKAPRVIACGTFTLDVASSTGSTFTGSLSFTVTGGSTGVMIPGVDNPPEPVAGRFMALPNGALFVSFAGSSPVPLFGSFASPSATPSPSIDPAQLGCPPIERGGLLGLVHLPMQGTEGLTIYGAPVAAFP